MYHCPLSFLAIQRGRKIKASSFSKSQLETQSPLNVIVCQLSVKGPWIFLIVHYLPILHISITTELSGNSILIDRVNYTHCLTGRESVSWMFNGRQNYNPKCMIFYTCCYKKQITTWEYQLIPLGHIFECLTYCQAATLAMSLWEKCHHGTMVFSTHVWSDKLRGGVDGIRELQLHCLPSEMANEVPQSRHF